MFNLFCLWGIQPGAGGFGLGVGGEGLGVGGGGVGGGVEIVDILFIV